MSRAVRLMGLAVALVAVSAVVAGGVAAKPAGSGPGNSPNAKLCQKGGWQNLVRTDGTSFASEEECTAYAAGGGTLQPKPTYPEARALCASFGGTFGVGGPDQVQGGVPGALVLWVCNDVPETSDRSAQQAALTAANKANEVGLRSVEVRVSGPGSGRESAVRALATAGLDVRTIRDTTAIPHNGCRPPKKRRV